MPKLHLLACSHFCSQHFLPCYITFAILLCYARLFYIVLYYIILYTFIDHVRPQLHTPECKFYESRDLCFPQNPCCLEQCLAQSRNSKSVY